MMLHSPPQRMELFVIVMFLTATDAQESQMVGPVNTVSFVGSTVALRCASPSRNCIGIDWQKYAFGASPTTVFKGPKTILNTNVTDRDRYSVDNSSGCDLVIRNVQLTDAGRFICSALLSTSQTTKTAYLIVLETQPMCTRNSTENTTVEEDRLQLNCEVLYNGASRATIAWKAGNDSPDDVEKGPLSNCTVMTPQNKTKEVPSIGKLTTITNSERNKTSMQSTGSTNSSSVALNGKTICQSYIVVASAPEVPSFTCIVTFLVETAYSGVAIAGLATNIPNAMCITPGVTVLYTTTTTTTNPFQYIMMTVAVGILLLIILLIVCFCTESCPGYKFYNSGNKSKDALRDEQPRTENPDVIYSVVNKGQDIHSKSKSPNRPKGAPPPRPKAGHTDALQHEEVTYADLAMEYGPRKVIPQNGQAAQEESLYAAVSAA